MFRNQYLITESQDSTKILAGARRIPFGDWQVYLFSPLCSAHVKRSDLLEALLIGVAVDPKRPDRDLQAVLEAVVDPPSPSADKLAARIQSLTGRFVLVAIIRGQEHVWGDACHLRQILFGKIRGVRCVASSEKLMLEHVQAELEMSPAKVRFMASPLFRSNEHAWVGADAHDDRISRLLPNHRLDLTGHIVVRQPLDVRDLPSSSTDIQDFACTALQGTFRALASSYRLIQPLTAGWDSRMLLAASLPTKDAIRYYIFDRKGDQGTAHDARIAEMLQRLLNLDFKRIVPAEVSDDFLAVLSAEQLFPRVLSKTANIQHHYRRPDRDRLININGNGAEVARCYYGRPGRVPSFSMICHYLGYSPGDPYVRDSLLTWYHGVKDVAGATGIAVSDLLYWEQRMGNWGASTPFEQDVAIEEVSPFNNKNLLLALLRVPSLERCAPDYPFFMRLLRAMNPHAADVPINPHVPRYKKYIERSATATFLGKYVKHVFASWRNVSVSAGDS